jgi:heme/copper-type cytochrome/quinol oxidase subunit 3
MKMEGELHHLQWKNSEDAKKEKRETRKRRIKKAGLISLIISTILMFANFLLGKLAGNILGIILWGGEMSDTIGFGVRLFKTYPMSAIDEPVVSSSSLYFEPISFIITVLLIMVIAYPICCSIEKRKKK